MKVKTITIGRLYNLGNYEHIRYDVSVELEDGDDPAVALRNLSGIIKDLNPKGKISDWEYESAKQQLADSRTDPEQRQKAEKKVLRRAYEKQRRVIAAEALSNIGGSEHYKDAKLDWDEDNQPF